MRPEFERLIQLVGEEDFESLQKKRVLVFGIGGVGATCVEALVRGGVGKIDLVDDDVIEYSNFNRQIHAGYDSLGMYKVFAMRRRIENINRDCQVRCYVKRLLPGNIGDFRLHECDYVIDAIDTMTSKIALAQYCYEHDIPLLSSMGTGNKLDILGYRIGDVFETHGDPIARVMRRELRKRGIPKLEVVWSDEKGLGQALEGARRKAHVGTISYMPPACGMILASVVLRRLLSMEKGAYYT